MDFGTLISQARASQRPKVSQKALADLVGVHQTTISAFERGEQRPTMAQARAIAQALDLPPARLLEVAGYTSAFVERDGKTVKVWLDFNDQIVDDLPPQDDEQRRPDMRVTRPDGTHVTIEVKASQLEERPPEVNEFFHGTGPLTEGVRIWLARTAAHGASPRVAAELTQAMFEEIERQAREVRDEPAH